MDFEKQAIDILKTFSSNEPYQLGYSGGKDSDVILYLAKKSRVPFHAIHNLTTVDAPETIKYIKTKKGVVINRPKMSMWQLIVQHKTPPTRIIRYCCEELKERSGNGKKVITGVRKAESRNREKNHGVVTFPKPKKDVKNAIDNKNVYRTSKGGVIILNYDNSDSRRIVEGCYRTAKTLVNPILDWDDEFLWWYIRKNQIEINPLYKEGFSRIGCIGCPMAGKGRWKEFARWVKYKNLYIKAFERMIDARNKAGLKTFSSWTSGEKVFRWWMEDKTFDGQYEMQFAGLEYTGIKAIE